MVNLTTKCRTYEDIFGTMTEWRKDNGDLHREDGPAVIYHDGDVEYWLNGEEYSFQEWDILKKFLWLL